MSANEPSAFQARLRMMLDSQNQRKKLLEAERVIGIARREEYRERQSRARQFHQTGLKFSEKAKTITSDIKALQDQKDDTALALKVLELRQRSLNEELFELQRTRDKNRTFYDSKQEEIRNFKIELRDWEHIQIKDAEQRDEFKYDKPKDRQFAAASECDVEDDGSELTKTRLILAKEAISREVRSNLTTLGISEQRLREALLRCETKKRDLAPAVETLKAEITILQTTERNLEDQVLQAITRRDERKRELHELEGKLAKRKRLFYGCDNSQKNVGERSNTPWRVQ